MATNAIPPTIIGWNPLVSSSVTKVVRELNWRSSVGIYPGSGPAQGGYSFRIAEIYQDSAFDIAGYRTREATKGGDPALLTGGQLLCPGLSAQAAEHLGNSMGIHICIIAYR